MKTKLSYPTVAALAAAVLAAGAPARADLPVHSGQTFVVALSGKSSASVTVVRSRRSVPWNARVYVDARFNGHRPEVVYNSARTQVTFVWHGVIAVASCVKRLGPVQLNIGSARVGGRPVRVRVTFSWKS